MSALLSGSSDGIISCKSVITPVTLFNGVTEVARVNEGVLSTL